jgi:hypothetical protein
MLAVVFYRCLFCLESAAYIGLFVMEEERRLAIGKKQCEFSEAKLLSDIPHMAVVQQAA